MEAAPAKPARARRTSQINRSRAKILGAAELILLERGALGFTIEALIERTGMARTTIYRHWRSRDDLLGEALGALIETWPMPETGTVKGDLIEFFLLRSRALESGEWRRGVNRITGLAGAGPDDPHLSAAMARSSSGTLNALRALIERGKARGELRADADSEAAASLLLGAALARRVYLDLSVGEPFVTAIVETMLKGLAARDC